MKLLENKFLTSVKVNSLNSDKNLSLPLALVSSRASRPRNWQCSSSPRAAPERKKVGHEFKRPYNAGL